MRFAPARIQLIINTPIGRQSGAFRTTDTCARAALDYAVPTVDHPWPVLGGSSKPIWPTLQSERYPLGAAGTSTGSGTWGNHRPSLQAP